MLYEYMHADFDGFCTQAERQTSLSNQLTLPPILHGSIQVVKQAPAKVSTDLYLSMN